MRRNGKTTTRSRTISIAIRASTSRKGLFATGGDISEIEGENTVKRDVDNDTTRSGAVPETERERENK